MNQAPHRGVMILVFGIVGLVACLPFGIAAWVMGNRDLAEIDAGRMDPEGRGMTQAGRVCGMVAVGITALIVLVWIVGAVVFGLSAAAQ